MCVLFYLFNWIEWECGGFWGLGLGAGSWVLSIYDFKVTTNFTYNFDSVQKFTNMKLIWILCCLKNYSFCSKKKLPINTEYDLCILTRVQCWRNKARATFGYQITSFQIPLPTLRWRDQFLAEFVSVRSALAYGVSRTFAKYGEHFYTSLVLLTYVVVGYFWHYLWFTPRFSVNLKLSSYQSVHKSIYTDIVALDFRYLIVCVCF